MKPKPVAQLRVDGIDRSTAPHLVPPGSWFNSFGMRFTKGNAVQYPRKVLYGRALMATKHPVSAISSIPVGHRTECHTLFFHQGKIFVIDQGDGLVPLDGDNVFNTTDLPYQRWATKMSDGKVFFTNLANPVAWTNGTRIYRYPGKVPSAKFIEYFYDHLVVFNVKFGSERSPFRVMWSDLYKVGDWVPARTNEADFYDCVECAYPSGQAGEGTGIGKIGDFLYAHTPCNIYRIAYVGLPRVMQVVPTGIETGCDCLYGLVSTGRAQFFPSFQDRDFYAFDGTSLKSIGAKIADFFFDDLLESHVANQKIWGFYDHQNAEVGWVYSSKTSTPISGFDNVYDKAVVFNLREGSWYVIPAEDVWCFHSPGVQGESLETYAGSTWNQYHVAGGGGNSTETVFVYNQPRRRFWGSSNGKVLRDAVVADDPATFIQTPLPFLETPDLTLGDLENVKEAHSMVIHGKNPDGIKVYTAQRSLLQDAISFVAQAQTWLATLSQGRLSLPKLATRILRYRFEPVMPAGGVSTPTVLSKVLHLSLPPVPMSSHSFVVDGSGPTSGRFYPPKVGTYMVIVGGGGGGGGARAILTTNTFTWTDTATDIAVRGVAAKKTRRKWRGTSAIVPLQDWFANDGIDPSGLYKVYIPDEAGVDPHLYATMSTTLKQALYDAAAAFILKKVALDGNVFNGYLNFRFTKIASGGAKGFLWTSWLDDGRSLTVMPANVWVLNVEHVTLTTSQRELQSGGGGSGAFVAAYLTFNSKTEYADYRLGLGGANTTDGSNTTGLSGGNSKVWSDAIGYTIQANGGTGAVPGVGDITDGVGGTVSVTAAGRVTTALSSNGVNGVREAPVSGLPITTKARGGTPISLLAVRGFGATVKNRGLSYGGGGCGQGADFDTNLELTKGGNGYIEFRWLEDGSFSYPADVPFNVSTTNFRLLASEGAAFDTGIGTLPGTGTFTWQVRVRGVLEMQNYPGGTAFGTNAKKDPSSTNPAVLQVILFLDDEAYYINHSSVPKNCCVDLEHLFSVVYSGGSSVKLQIIPPDSEAIYAPRAEDGKALYPSHETHRYKSQWVTVEVFAFNQANNKVNGFEFTAYVDNVYAGAAEK